MQETKYRGKKAPAYGSGRSASLPSGYIRIRRVGHPLAGADGYVYEHRLVIWEAGIDPRGWVIHHLNHDKTDNRLENLELLSNRKHSTQHARERGFAVNQFGIWPLRNAPAS